MQAVMSTVFFATMALPSCVFATVLQAKDTPVSKVVEMLREMKVKGEKEMAAEKAIFQEYATRCHDTGKDVNFEIKTYKTSIEKDTATQQKATADANARASKVKALNGQLESLQSELDTATEERNGEEKVFQESQKDLSESVDALERAIQVFESQNFNRPEAELFMQQNADKVAGMPRVLAAYLQMTQDSSDEGAPAVAAYKSQSGGIVDMLEKLHDKFSKELRTLEEENVNRAHQYALQKQHIEAAIADSEKDKRANQAQHDRARAAASEAAGRLSDTKASLADSEDFLSTMLSQQAAKTVQFQANQELRKSELEAVGKAIEIMSSSDVQDGYGQHIKFAQVGSGAPALLQMAASSRARAAVRSRVAALLHQRATLLSSKLLAKAATEVEANPFKKIITMVESLIARLKEEAKAEADHKQWCDKELSANEKKRKARTSQKDSLTAEVEKLSATIDILGREVSTLQEEQRKLGADMKAASETRAKESAENKQTIADAKAGSAAVKKALVVLKDFYGDQSSFLQGKAKKAPSNFDVPEMAEYKGMHGSSGGVVGMMEVIATDFQRLDSETTAEEAEAAREHEAFMKKATASKKLKHKSEVKKALEKDQAEFDRAQKKKDLSSVSEELTMAMEYFEELKPQCLEVKVSYEDRVARREEEIQALKEAYELLDQKQ